MTGLLTGTLILFTSIKILERAGLLFLDVVLGLKFIISLRVCVSGTAAARAPGMGENPAEYLVHLPDV